MKQRNKKKLVAILIAMVMVLSLVVTNGVANAASKKLKVTVKTKTVAINQTITLKTNVKSKFKSSNKKIATVSAKGVVKGKKAGTVKITVTSKLNKKQKKTVKITVIKPKKTTETTTEAPTTETPTEVTTQQPTTEVVKPVEKPTTETPTAQQPTVVDPKPEKPTVEPEDPTPEDPTPDDPTPDDPTPEDPTPEEKILVGIEARYRGEKVPKGSNIVEQGLIITEKFSDGTNTEVKTFDSETMPDISENYTSTQDGGKEYQTYTVTYKGKTAPLKVEVVDVGDTLYPIQFMAIYKGEATDEIPKMEDISMSFVWSDKTSSDDVDTSKVQVTFFEYPEVQEIGYYVTYHYTFKDTDDNDLYVCVRRLMYVPYE